MASASSADGSSEYVPTYRERHIDDELEDHNRRISRLEKAALIGGGYLLAEMPKLMNDLLGFLL